MLDFITTGLFNVFFWSMTILIGFTLLIEIVGLFLTIGVKSVKGFIVRLGYILLYTGLILMLWSTNALLMFIAVAIWSLIQLFSMWYITKYQR